MLYASRDRRRVHLLVEIVLIVRVEGRDGALVHLELLELDGALEVLVLLGPHPYHLVGLIKLLLHLPHVQFLSAVVVACGWGLRSPSVSEGDFGLESMDLQPLTFDLFVQLLYLLEGWRVMRRRGRVRLRRPAWTGTYQHLHSLIGLLPVVDDVQQELELLEDLIKNCHGSLLLKRPLALPSSLLCFLV